jgi:hypothetical protein
MLRIYIHFCYLCEDFFFSFLFYSPFFVASQILFHSTRFFISSFFRWKLFFGKRIFFFLVFNFPSLFEMKFYNFCALLRLESFFKRKSLTNWKLNFI